MQVGPGGRAENLSGKRERDSWEGALVLLPRSRTRAVRDSVSGHLLTRALRGPASLAMPPI